MFKKILQLFKKEPPTETISSATPISDSSNVKVAVGTAEVKSWETWPAAGPVLVSTLLKDEKEPSTKKRNRGRPKSNNRKDNRKK